MSVIKECSVEFKDGRSSYAPGEKVSGRILMQLEEKILCGRIEVTFHGSSQVHWSENEQLPDQKIVVNKFSKEEVYFHEKQSAWIYIEDDREMACQRVYRKAQLKSLSKDSIWIHSRLEDKDEAEPTGIFGRVNSKVGGRAKVRNDVLSFDFSFQLPSGNLPNSYHAKDAPASVTYFVEVALAGFFHDVKARRFYLTVLNDYELRNMEQADVSVTKEVTYKFAPPVVRKFSLAKRPPTPDDEDRVKSITTYVDLPRKGFVPANEIPVTVEIANDSSKSIKAIQAQLVQTLVCQAEKPEKKTKTFELVVADALKLFEKSGRRDSTCGSPPTSASLSPDWSKERSLSVVGPSPRRLMGGANRSLSSTAETEPEAEKIVRRKSSVTQWITARVRRMSASEGPSSVSETLQVFVPTNAMPNFSVEGFLSVNYLLRVLVFLFRDQPASIKLDIPIFLGTRFTQEPILTAGLLGDSSGAGWQKTRTASIKQGDADEPPIIEQKIAEAENDENKVVVTSF